MPIDVPKPRKKLSDIQCAVMAGGDASNYEKRAGRQISAFCTSAFSHLQDEMGLRMPV